MSPDSLPRLPGNVYQEDGASLRVRALPRGRGFVVELTGSPRAGLGLAWRRCPARANQPFATRRLALAALRAFAAHRQGLQAPKPTKPAAPRGPAWQARQLRQQARALERVRDQLARIVTALQCSARKDTADD